MSNYKRRKPRKQVRCTLCTDSRIGNSKASGFARRQDLLRWQKEKEANDYRNIRE